LDNMILEGLAENFKEYYFDSQVSPWAGALARHEAMTTLDLLLERLYSTDSEIIEDVLFGNSKFPKWAGYSTGYWLVNDFINLHPHLSWNEIMKLDSMEFIK